MKEGYRAGCLIVADALNCQKNGQHTVSIRYIHYYALCIEDKVINLEVVRNMKGRESDCTYECEWIIEKINLPDDWTYDFINKDNLKNIITDVFRVETFSKTLNLSNIKSINVLIAADF